MVADGDVMNSGENYRIYLDAGLTCSVLDAAADCCAHTREHTPVNIQAVSGNAV